MAERKRKPRTRAQKDAAAAKARERRRRNRRPTGRRRGRSEKIDQEVEYRDKAGEMRRVKVGELVLQQIRSGVPQKYAASAAGVDETTVIRWRQRGAEALMFAGGDLDAIKDERERVYANFASQFVRADGTRIALVANALWEKARRGDVRAAVEYLRAQAADEFREVRRVEFEGDRKPPPLVPETQEGYRRAFAAAFADQLPELDPSELAPPEDWGEKDEGDA